MTSYLINGINPDALRDAVRRAECAETDSEQSEVLKDAIDALGQPSMLLSLYEASLWCIEKCPAGRPYVAEDETSAVAGALARSDRRAGRAGNADNQAQSFEYAIMASEAISELRRIDAIRAANHERRTTWLYDIAETQELIDKAEELDSLLQVFCPDNPSNMPKISFIVRRRLESGAERRGFRP